MERRAIRVGVCDDLPLFRSGLRTLVKETAGLELAFEVGNLAELRAVLGRGPVDLVLLD